MNERIPFRCFPRITLTMLLGSIGFVATAFPNPIVATQAPITVRNSFSGGTSIAEIRTYDYATYELLASFLPANNNNGRGVEVIGNEVFYTGIGTDESLRDIYVAPFHGGLGGAIARTIRTPRPEHGIQDLDYSNGVLYALTGYPWGRPVVYALNPTDGTVLRSVSIQLQGQPGTNADGFTVLPNGDFLINDGDTSYDYRGYDGVTGNPTGLWISAHGPGVDFNPVDQSLYFAKGERTDLAGNLLEHRKFVPGETEDMCVLPANPCVPSPVAFHRFDYNPPNVGYDSSGSRHVGVLGSASVVSAACGSALNCLPDNNVAEFTIPHASDLDLTGPMSGMALIRPLGAHGGIAGCLDGTIFSKGGNYWFSVATNNDGLVFRNDDSGLEAARVDVDLCVGGWTQVAFVRAEDGRTVRFFVNGLPTGSPTTLTNLAAANSSDIMVGSYGPNDDPSACQFNGEIDEIRIYDRALSDAEILDAYVCGCRAGLCGAMAQFCFPNAGGIRSCPCGNQPVPDNGTRGCNNYGPTPPGGTGGAILDATGDASTSAPTTLVFHVTQMQTPCSLVVLLGGFVQLSPGVESGGGIRCVAGLQVPRLYKSASGFNSGSIDFPSANANPNVDAWTRSNSPQPGTTEHYYAAYRNGQLGNHPPCTPANAFNTTNAGSITWHL